MNIIPHFNTLYYGDCQDILTQFPDTYVDLICLDRPFNSNQDFNQIFKNSGLKDIEPQIRAFDDTWNWNPESADRVKRVKSAIANPAAKVIEAFEICIPASKMLAYTSYMAERLYQMHRLLKLPPLTNPGQANPFQIHSWRFSLRRTLNPLMSRVLL